MPQTDVPSITTPNTHDEAYYRNLERFRPWNERAMWAAFAHLGRPSSFLDVGCGDAWTVRTARMAGIRPALGIELSQDVKKLRPKWASIYVANPAQPMDLKQRFALVVSLGVAERFTKDDSIEAYCANLASHTQQWLVLSSSRLTRDEWHMRLEQHGMIYDADQTAALRQTWGQVLQHEDATWLPEHLLVFRREPEVKDCNDERPAE